MASASTSSKYIPAGCLRLQEDGTSIPHGLWSSSAVSDERRFSTSNGAQAENGHGVDGHADLQFLPTGIQQIIFDTTVMRPFRELFVKRWIELGLLVCRDDPSWGIVRVYILADDVDRTVIDRSNASLRRARLNLLSSLDFSTLPWTGHLGGDLCRRPRRTTEEEDTAGQQSLLQMFNSIPSPNPDPNALRDLDSRETIANILGSDIPGLKTTLYPYQSKSAALMLQRESEPGQVLDPRLEEVQDQDGNAWYYDAVSGTCLRAPRHYDGVCGGILAEEMGAGKTLICLSLILATKHQVSRVPDLYQRPQTFRHRVGSLMDMAASTITKNSVPWKLWFDDYVGTGIHYPNCVAAITRNPGWYEKPQPPRRRQSRLPFAELPPTRVYVSNASLIIVPANLVKQWRQEIAKHTIGLKIAVFDKKLDALDMTAEDLLHYDIILFSTTRFFPHDCLRQIHFKRCIVDEGHILGNSRMGNNKSNLVVHLDQLQIDARWIVTGTPSAGLYGVDDELPTPLSSSPSTPTSGPIDSVNNDPLDSQGVRQNTLNESSSGLGEPSREQEKKDLQRIGAIATLYLKLRPWANTIEDAGDTPADWSVYNLQSPDQSRGRLRGALESLIIRHPRSEISNLLPVVEERVVYLDGSYQDKLALNLFSMMIIFNAVQSQRTDQDYFFHPKQRKNLLQLVHNLRQSSFFGGSFFAPLDIDKAVETAAKFLEDGKIEISKEDDNLLREAVYFGQLASKNGLKVCANLFHEIPVYVKNFPGGLGESWSLDQKGGDPVCMDARMISLLQTFLQSTLDAPNSLQLLFDDGRFVAKGREERIKILEDQAPASSKRAKTLAGDTQLGEDHSTPRKRKSTSSSTIKLDEPSPPQSVTDSDTHSTPKIDIASVLAPTQIISTASAKLSHLVDEIVRHQHAEQIIVFYENDNVAYYLAGMLDILGVQHLIYAKSIKPERRAQYVDTFNRADSKFRVMLMDIAQAAFGIDMRGASRIYFINPVLNPQVEAQAIGRARRISQKKPVTVETLVLKGSLEEVIVQRKREMTAAEQRKCKTILDDRPIYEWILNAQIVPMPTDVSGDDGLGQTAPLKAPQLVFGRGFGREIAHPDEGLVVGDAGLGEAADGGDHAASSGATSLLRGKKRKIHFAASASTTPSRASTPMEPTTMASSLDDGAPDVQDGLERPTRRVRFSDDST